MLEALECSIEHLTLLLHLSQLDQNPSNDVTVRELINLIEHSKGFRLVVDCIVNLFSFQVGRSKLQVTITNLFRSFPVSVNNDLQRRKY